MGCPNFSYERRCLVVTNEDYEDGNRPEIGGMFDDDRTYPSSYLEDWEGEFATIAVVMTAGYNTGACIDIRDDDRLKPELDCSDWHFARLTRDELFDELSYYFNGHISKRMMLKHLKGLDRRSEDYQSRLAYAVDDIFVEVREREVAIADKILDGIRKDYGYDEIGCMGVFSNGEAIYRKI